MNKKFKKLGIINCKKISDEGIQKFRNLSLEPLVELEYTPSSTQELLTATVECDGLITSLGIDIPREVFENNKSLRYIGICGSNLLSVNLEAAKEHSVTVKNVTGYCDNETAQFSIVELVNLARGLGSVSWRSEPHSLEGKVLGIIGLGAVGYEVAKLAISFGMEVLYFGRTRKSKIENDKLRFAVLDTLLKECNFLSLHSPPRIKIMERKHFNTLEDGKILINTCVGKVFDENDFLDWLRGKENFAIFDSVAASYFSFPNKIPANLIISDRSAYKTKESYIRVGDLAVEHAKNFLRS